MIYEGVWGSIENFDIADSLIVALIAILIVFAALVLIIFISWIFHLGIEKVNAKTHILPKETNKILDEDEDAVAAVLVATIDFYKTTGKEPEILSVSRIED